MVEKAPGCRTLGQMRLHPHFSASPSGMGTLGFLEPISRESSGPSFQQKQKVSRKTVNLDALCRPHGDRRRECEDTALARLLGN